jgi:hypothetical protein
MKFFTLFFSIPFLISCTVNIYHEKIDSKPKLFVVTSIHSEQHLSVDLKEQNTNKIHTNFKILDKCKDFIQIGDILLLDSVTKTKNGFTTIEVLATEELHDFCFGKI